MSNVRSAAVARQEQPQAPSQGTSIAAVVRQSIERQATAFRSVLPKTTDPERFSRLVLTAVKSAPDLMRCFETTQGQTSVLLAAMQAATMGLEPNTLAQQAWILPRRNNGVWEAQLSVGYRGLLSLARRSGDVKTIFADVVREGDVFNYARGVEADLFEHKPEGDGTAPLTHAYAVVRFKDGGYNFVVLNRAQVEQRRAQSDSWKNTKSRPYSPWTKWEESMWRKSAIRELSKFLELSPELVMATSSEEQSFSWGDDNEIVPMAFETTTAITTPSEDPSTASVATDGASVETDSSESSEADAPAATEQEEAVEDTPTKAASSIPDEDFAPPIDNRTKKRLNDALNKAGVKDHFEFIGNVLDIEIDKINERTMTMANADQVFEAIKAMRPEEEA